MFLLCSFVEKLNEQRRYSEAALLLDQYAKVSSSAAMTNLRNSDTAKDHPAVQHFLPAVASQGLNA